MTDSAYSVPLVVGKLGTFDECEPLQRIPLVRRAGEAGYDERWIQELIQRYPHLLPIRQIEPALTPVVPVCMELPTSSGYIDNLLVTPNGGLVVVECKLWRNPEARREVIGQVLDYAKDLSRWSYGELEAAIRLALHSPDWRLWDKVAEVSDLDEAGFYDAITRNLRHARILLLIVGDGIHEGAGQLTEYLQRHVAAHFSLALVELGLWRLPGDAGILVQPRILLRTTTIERGVVTLSGGTELTGTQPAVRPKATTLTEEMFYEQLAAVEPGFPSGLKAFLASLEPLGVMAEIRKTLIIRWRSPDGGIFRLAQIWTNGQVWTDNWQGGDDGSLALRHRYLELLATTVPGVFIKKTPSIAAWYIATAKGVVMLSELLAHAEAWRAAIERFIEEVRLRPADPE